MVYIFHGDDQFQSRLAFSQLLESFTNCQLYKTEAKSLDLDSINLLFNSTSLFYDQKVIAIGNFFSLNKSQINQILKHHKKNPSVELLLWQDKKLTQTQIKIFPQAKISYFPINRLLFQALNNLKPNNINRFLDMLSQVLIQEPYDLVLYLFKNSLRKQLTTYTQFDINKLTQAYLSLIELDYQNKTGQLTTPKDIALERIFLKLMT